jgi:hypothetical protein
MIYCRIMCGSQAGHPERRQAVVYVGSKVSIDAGALRPYLLRWLTDESAHMAAAIRFHDIEQAQMHHLRAVAIAALLARIGMSADAEAAVTIDALQHGWAAREALRALMIAEEDVIDRESAAGEHEAAGEAMGRRHDARVAITEIEEAAERHGNRIKPPTRPPGNDREISVRRLPPR